MARRVQRNDRRPTVIIVAIILSLISGISAFAMFLALEDMQREYDRILLRNPKDNYTSELEAVEANIRKITTAYSAEKTGLLDRYKELYAQLHGVPFDDPDGTSEHEGEINLTEKHKRRWLNARKTVLDESKGYHGTLLSTIKSHKEIRDQKDILIQELNKEIKKQQQTLMADRESNRREIMRERKKLEELKEKKKNIRKDFREKTMQLSLIRSGLKKRLDEIKHAGERIRTVEDLSKLSREELAAEAKKENIPNIDIYDKSELIKKIFQKRQIDGTVLTANPDMKIVVINRGSVNGVEPKQEFDVFSLEHGIVKTPKGRIRIQKVEDQVSYAKIIEMPDDFHPIIEGDHIGHVEYKTGEQKSFVLTGNFSENYNERELSIIIRDSGGKIEAKVGVGTDYLIAGDPPGKLPPREVIDKIVELYLYNNKSLNYIEKEFRLKPELARYVTMLYSARELGTRIFSQKKLLEFLKWKNHEVSALNE